MPRFEVGGLAGPGRPPLDEDAKRVREIIREKLTPALPGILDRLLSSRHPRVVLQALKTLLPYVAVRQSATVDSRAEQRAEVTERVLLAILEDRKRRAPAADAATPQSPQNPERGEASP